MMQAVFCSGVRSLAIVGLTHPLPGLNLNTVEAATFLAAAKELLYAPNDVLFAADYPALYESACIVNKRENWFWQVGYEGRRMGEAHARQRICLALPASMGAGWLSGQMADVDCEETGVDILCEIEAFRGTCDHHLYELERVFNNGWKAYTHLPIDKAAADAWRAVRSVGGLLLLIDRPKRSCDNAEAARHVA